MSENRRSDVVVKGMPCVEQRVYTMFKNMGDQELITNVEHVIMIANTTRLQNMLRLVTERLQLSNDTLAEVKDMVSLQGGLGS